MGMVLNGLQKWEFIQASMFPVLDGYIHNHRLRDCSGVQVLKQMILVNGEEERHPSGKHFH